MINKKSFSIGILFLQILFNLQAQKRFQSEVFTATQINKAIPYGLAKNEKGKNQALLLNLFSPPKNDTMQWRPLILFINGSNSADVSFSLIANNSFSKRGYITAVIPFRKSSKQAPNAIQHDAEAALLFFKKNAAVYQIDTSQIFIGGSSQGASAALAVAYSPTNEVSTKVHGVINAGGRINPFHIQQGNAPLFNMESLTKIDEQSNGYELYKKCVELGIGTYWKSFENNGKSTNNIQQKIQTSIESISAWLYTQLRINQINNRENVLRYEKDIIRFDSLNLVEKYPENSILFLGSSYIRLWANIREDLEYKNIIHRGFGGSNLKDVAYYIKRIVYPHQPKAIFMYVGNDIIVDERDKTPEQALELFKYTVNIIRGKYPSVPITWLAVSPSERRWSKWKEVIALNQKIKNYCESNPNLYFIDSKDQFLGADDKPIAGLFRDDKLHYNLKGYQLWGARIKKEVKAIVEK